MDVQSITAFLEEHKDAWTFIPHLGFEKKKEIANGILRFLLNLREPMNRSTEESCSGQALSLIAIRTLLREKEAMEECLGSEAISLYLECIKEEGDESEGYAVCLNSLRCLGNATNNDPQVQQILINLGGIRTLHGVLKLARPPIVWYFILRNLYYILGNHPAEVLSVVTECFVETLVSTLNWCITQQTPFAEGGDSVDVAVQCLRMLFFLRTLETESNINTEAKENDAENKVSSNAEPRITVESYSNELVDLLCLLFQISGEENGARKTQLEAASLLMFMPAATYPKFSQGTAIDGLVNLLQAQLESSGHLNEEENTDLTRILICLNNFAEKCIELRCRIKEIIFPPEADKVWQERMRNEPRNSASRSGPMGVPESKMHPVDAPKGSLRANLIGQLTSLHSMNKRYAGELLFELCNKNADEFVWRTGFGNAVVVLQSKGLVGSDGTKPFGMKLP